MVTATVLLLTWYLGRYLSKTAVFVGAIAALSISSGCGTVLLYCSMTNFLAVGTAIIAIEYTRRASEKCPWPWLAAFALTVALLVLSKQSIGILAVPCCAAIILFHPVKGGFPQRVARLAAFALFIAIFFAAICALLSPWVSLSGMIQDVFLTSTECKGGTKEVLLKLINYWAELGALGLLVALVFFAAIGSGFLTIQTTPSVESEGRAPWIPAFYWLPLTFAAALVCIIALGRMQLDLLPTYIETLKLGLVVCLVAVVLHAWAIRQGKKTLFDNDSKSWMALSVATLILLPCAAGYVVSAPMGWRSFYWYVPTNPFIQVAATALFLLVERGSLILPKKFTGPVVTLLAIVLLGVCWQSWRIHWADLKSCTQTWSDVTWFAGVKVTDRAEPLREVVNEIRQQTNTQDTVLLLPEDPNLEACFERPRPALSCAIVFADQYWGRYVANDFATLSHNPPKIIVLGPRNDWPVLSAEHNNSGAVEALMARVKNELLPSHYRLIDQHAFPFKKTTDYLDVWVRVD